MARVVLITGGSRSGKSSHAQRMAESMPGRRLFIATCPVIDEEMTERVTKHREEREGRGWRTVEETVNVARVIRDGAADADVFLVECLTLWVNNLMWEAEQRGEEMRETGIAERCHELLETCRGISGTVIMVTNEVGMGIVPDNALARRYRDLVGRCNQIIAAEADSVTLVTCGLPIQVK